LSAGAIDIEVLGAVKRSADRWILANLDILGIISAMWNMMAILISMLFFGLLHSLTAGFGLRNWLKRWLGERFVEGWYRLGYNSLSGLTLLPALALVVLLPDRILYRTPFPLALVPVAIQIVGLLGLVYSLTFTDLWRFVGLRQVWAYFNEEPLPLSPEPLQQVGIYGIVRHPQYSLALLVIWLTPVLTANWLAFNLAATLYMVVGSLVEERRLERAYGARYRDYQRRVPWLLPRPRRSTIWITEER
jgi:protein-S-isoprenylcysteine O-methyltransferase Ste14